MFMRRAFLTTGFMAAILLSAGRHAQAAEPTLQARFEKQVREYEAGDKASAPPRGAVLFAGGSRFFSWKTIAEDLQGYMLIYRGRGMTYITAAPPCRCCPTCRCSSPGCTPRCQGHTWYSSTARGPGRRDEALERREANQVLQKSILTQPDVAFVDL